MPNTRKSEENLTNLLHLRVLVGFLGQSKINDWWDCKLLDQTGIRFLETIFPRSAHLAALHSTVEAAAKAHDASTGRIGLFHLFRLPIGLEDRLFDIEKKRGITDFFSDLEDSESAIARLKSLSADSLTAPEGPVQIGVESKILTKTSIEELAAHYCSAFEQEIQCFPYFGPNKKTS